MNIYEKICSIMDKVQGLQKDDLVQFGNTKYKALSEEKVTRIMRQQMIDHKLVVFPIQQTSSRTGNISHVDVVYRMVNVENPEEFIDIASAGDGADTQDKGTGKAMTYAFKYMWLRTFALPTGEDPDRISSEQLDAEDKMREREAKSLTAPISEKDAEMLQKLLKPNQIEAIMAQLGIYSLTEMTSEQYANVMRSLNEKEKKNAKQSKTA